MAYKKCGRTSRDNILGGRVTSFKNAHLPPKTTSAQNAPRKPLSGPPCGCFFLIPRVFLLLPAGFLTNFAKSGPVSGHFCLCSVLARLFYVAKGSLFRPPMVSWPPQGISARELAQGSSSTRTCETRAIFHRAQMSHQECLLAAAVLPFV